MSFIIFLKFYCFHLILQAFFFFFWRGDDFNYPYYGPYNCVPYISYSLSLLPFFFLSTFWFRARFLNFSTWEILNQISFLLWCLGAMQRIIECIAAPLHLMAVAPPSHDKMSKTLLNIPWEAKSLLRENHLAHFTGAFLS